MSNAYKPFDALYKRGRSAGLICSTSNRSDNPNIVGVDTGGKHKPGMAINCPFCRRQIVLERGDDE